MTRDLTRARVTFWGWEAGTREPEPQDRRVADARAVETIFRTVSKQDSYVLIVEPRDKSRLQVSVRAEDDAAVVEIARNRNRAETTTRTVRSALSLDGRAMDHGLDRVWVPEVLAHYLFGQALPEAVTLDPKAERRGIMRGVGIALLGVVLVALILALAYLGQQLL